MMRLLIAVLCTGLFSFTVKAQTKPTSGSQNMKVETTREAEYPKGDQALFEYLFQHIKYTEEAKKNKAEGEVTVSFLVEADSTLSNIRIIKDVGYGCGEAVKEALVKVKYSPAMVNGTIMKSKMLLNVPVRAH